MIERETFKATWARLCRRFGQDNDPEMASEFFVYLAQRLDTEGFLAAAQAVWSTSRFFPRPADFLAVRQAADWALVQEAIAGFHGPDWPWAAVWKLVSELGREATTAVGGVEGLAQFSANELLHAKREWDRAYEGALVTDAVALPPAPVVRLLR